MFVHIDFAQIFFMVEMIKFSLFESNVNCSLQPAKVISNQSPPWLVKVLQLILLAAIFLFAQMPFARGHCLRERRSLPFPPLPGDGDLPLAEVQPTGKSTR